MLTMMLTIGLTIASAGATLETYPDVANLVFDNPWTPDLISDDGRVPEVVFFTETARFCVESSVSSLGPDDLVTNIMRGRFSWEECADLSFLNEASKSTIEIGNDVFFGQIYIHGEYYEIMQNDGSLLFHLVALAELAPESKERRELFVNVVAPYHLVSSGASCEGNHQTNWNVAQTDNAQTCASAIAADPSLCPSGIFMVAPGQPHWNCRCCSPTGWNHHDYWNIFALDKSVMSTEDFCASGAVNADPNLCAQANCNGTPMCTWSQNRCIRNSAVADQPVTQCGVVWEETPVASDLIRSTDDGECSGFVEYDSGRVFENSGDFEECKRYCKEEPLCRAVTLGEANMNGHAQYPHCWFHYASYSDCLSVARAHGELNSCYNWIGSGQPNHNNFVTYVFSQEQLQTVGYPTWSDQCWYKSSNSEGEKVLEVASIDPGCPSGTIEVDVNIYTRSWAYEIDWFLSQYCQNHNDHYLDYRPYYHHCCVPDRDLQLTCTDSYGDGWHGAKLTINGKQFCQQISTYWMYGRRSLHAGSQVQDFVSAADLHRRNLLSNPVEYAWVMSKWAWLIYNQKLFAETKEEQNWWTYGTEESKVWNLVNNGFQKVKQQELFSRQHPDQRFAGAAYIYTVNGHFRHWSREQSAGRIGVISMCGTEPGNLADFYADVSSLYCERINFGKHSSTWKAGYGFAQRFNSIKWSLDAAIQDFINHDIVDIYVTGHSLGGAMASIIAAYIKQGIHSDNWHPSVNLVTFGAPRTFCAAEADLLQQLTDQDDGTFTTMRIVNFNDVVTDLPLRAQGMKHFGKVYTMDSHHLDLLQPQQQDYQANHWGKDFLGVVDNILMIGSPIYLFATSGWGAFHDHIQYPGYLDDFHCPRSSCRPSSLTLSRCAYASQPDHFPFECAESGTFTRSTVNPDSIYRIQKAPKRFKLVATNTLCENGNAMFWMHDPEDNNPYHCAAVIAGDRSRCPNGIFAVAPGEPIPGNGCRCCLPRDVSHQWVKANGWKIYKFE